MDAHLYVTKSFDALTKMTIELATPLQMWICYQGWHVQSQHKEKENKIKSQAALCFM